MPKQSQSTNNINALINTSGCFDLQFRQDTKHNRLHSPTYYHWKVQFVITENSQKLDILEKIKNILKCGKIHVIKGQGRYSVQNIDEIKNNILPYFKKHSLNDKKKKDFELWQKAVEIICRNKRKIFSTWKKEDFRQLIDIQKKIKRYKEKPRRTKWLSTAEDLVKTL